VWIIGGFFTYGRIGDFLYYQEDRGSLGFVFELLIRK
jgi:hypothetical protein